MTEEQQKKCFNEKITELYPHLYVLEVVKSDCVKLFGVYSKNQTMMNDIEKMKKRGWHVYKRDLLKHAYPSDVILEYSRQLKCKNSILWLYRQFREKYIDILNKF